MTLFHHNNIIFFLILNSVRKKLFISKQDSLSWPLTSKYMKLS